MIIDRQIIKDWRGKILGYIDTDRNGNKIVRNFYRKVLGKYDKRTNTTRDFYGKLVAKGDQCSLLLGRQNIL